MRGDARRWQVYPCFEHYADVEVLCRNAHHLGGPGDYSDITCGSLSFKQSRLAGWSRLGHFHRIRVCFIDR
jgi:hypothetical protein